MAFYDVLVCLTLFGSVAALRIGSITSDEIRPEIITYDGFKAETHWSLDSAFELKRELQVLRIAVPNNMIPAFAFESKGHMERMVLQWGRLHEYNVSVRIRGGNDDWGHMSQAFQFIDDNTPPIAVWLLEYKDGRASTLEKLGEGFKRTRGSTRHIVFHWSPEFCDQGSAVFQRIKTAYEDAAAVFQFGYQDERLASLDKNKFKPWPLGAAFWKGWETPLSQLATARREHLACFRGAVNTHHDLRHLQALVSNKPEFIIEDSGQWTAHDSNKSKTRYKTMLNTSMYGLNLPGHNPNCYRVVESIESGAIPVIVARKGLHACYDNWSALYGHGTGTQYDWIPAAPFEVLESWDELPHHIEEMSSQAEARGSALGDWYGRWRQSFTEAFASTIQG